MAETADAVVMTCTENPHREVEGLESGTFAVHAVLCVPKGFEAKYVSKIVEPENIASLVAEPMLMEGEEFYFKTKAKVEPDTKLKIEISLAGESDQPLAN